MPAFRYVARDTAGRKVVGRLDAANEAAALVELDSRGLTPVGIGPPAPSKKGRGRVSTRHVARAYQQLADLLRAGVPLLKALRLLGRGRSAPKLASILGGIADEVAQGERFADAMAKHPTVFPPVQVAMVRAGERGAFLEQVLARLGTFLSHQADVRARVIGNLIYPIVLLLVGAGVVVASLVFFVPKFKDFYKKIELPIPTRILLGASDLFVERWGLLIVLSLALLGAAIVLVRSARVRRTLSDGAVRVPTLGPLLKSIATARFARTLGTLIENGIPLLAAMQIARDAAGHPTLVEAIDRASEAVRAGESLAKPLASSGFLEEDVIEMISVGESANNLGAVLLTLADTLEQRSDRTMSVLIRLLEPALLLLLAGVVLFIFMALIVPMMQLSSSM